MCKLPNKCAETVVAAFSEVIKTTMYEFKTITSDNGSEFAYHNEISEITGAEFYFANPYSSWGSGLTRMLHELSFFVA